MGVVCYFSNARDMLGKWMPCHRGGWWDSCYFGVVVGGVKFHIYLLCVYTHVHRGTCESKRTFGGVAFLPSTVWVPGIRMRLSDLAASSFTC